jgi:HEAT repeat protein
VTIPDPDLPEAAEPRSEEGLAGSIDRLFQGMEGEEAAAPEDEPLTPPPSLPAPAETLEREIAAYLEGAEGGSERLAARVEALSAVLEASGDLHPVASAVERLALEGDGGRDGALALARRLLSPAVARAVALKLGAAARDEARRASLTRALSGLGPAMAPALAEALTESEERVERRAYIEALTALGEGALPVVREMVTDSRWFVVRNAVLVLRDSGGEGAIEHFTTALANPDPRVRREALLSLAHVGGESASLLVPSKVADPDPEVRQAAAMATGALRVQRAVKPLLEQLEEEETPDVQEAILLALGQIGDPGAVPALEKRAVPGLFSRRPPTAVRVAAYRALWAIGTPHARKLVGDAEGDRDPEVRDAARRLPRTRG